jgi:hypothetical protein
MRTLLIALVAGAVCLCVRPAEASDPPPKKTAPAQAHGDKPAAAQPPAKGTAAANHATPAADEASHPAKPAAHAPAAPAAAAPTPVSPADVDLLEVRDRIHERVAELRKMQQARRGRTSSARTSRSDDEAHASGGRARTDPATTQSSPASRIDLVWRPTVTWPREAFGASAVLPSSRTAVAVPVLPTSGPEQ